MTRRASAVIAMAAMLTAPGAAEAQLGRHELQRIADGVYVALRVGPVDEAANGNSLVVVNDSDVLVVDATLTPEDAERLVGLIREVTPSPVRYLVNTHWHDDHVLGNMVFQEAWPGIEIIAHPFTRDTIAGSVASSVIANRVAYPEQLTELRTRLANNVTRTGQPLSAVQRQSLESAIRTYEWFIPQLERVEIVPPTLTVADSLVIRRGDREIRILHLGRGNTGGDLVVFLPREGIVATGDLLVNPIPFSFGSFLGEWVETLDRVRDLRATRIVPGHGPVLEDYAYLGRVQALLRHITAETAGAVERGLSLDETRAAVDLSAFRAEFAGDDPMRGLQFDAFLATPAVERAWLEARGELPARVRGGR